MAKLLVSFCSFPLAIIYIESSKDDGIGKYEEKIKIKKIEKRGIVRVIVLFTQYIISFVIIRYRPPAKRTFRPLLSYSTLAEDKHSRDIIIYYFSLLLF